MATRRLSLNDFKRRLQRRSAPTTVKTYISLIKKYLTFIGREDPSRENVERFIDHLLARKVKNEDDEEKKRRSAFSMLMVIRRYFKLMGRRDEIKDVEAPAFAKVRKDYITKHDLKRMIDACRTNGERAAVALLYAGALRNGELVALTRDDVKENGILVRPEKKRVRGGSDPVFVPIDDITMGHLKAYLKEHGRRIRKRLFPVTTETVRSAITRVCKRAGGIVTANYHHKVTPHTLRHSRITHLAKGGMNPFKLMKFARHADIDSTMEYVHIMDEDIMDVPPAFEEEVDETERENV